MKDSVRSFSVDCNELRFVVASVGLKLSEKLGRELTHAEVDMVIMEAVRRLAERRPTATVH